MPSLPNHKLAISTVSLGWHATHSLERKLAAAKANEFQGIELFITDLDGYAKSHDLSRLETCSRIKILCASHGLDIVCLGSFDNFEGEQSRSLRERLDVAAEWIEMARELGTDVIQIPSNDSATAIGDEKVIVSELQALSDLGSESQPTITFAYEALGWGIHVADWEESLRVVNLVDRSNFGLCLDTYHVISRLWADPRAKSGKRPGGDAALRDSIQRFLDSCPREKIIYVQLSDAERLNPPLLPGHPVYDVGKDGTHSWCTYGRLFPLEADQGAYLPMKDICYAWLVKSGWTGWVSMEIFHREMKIAEKTPEHWAARGRISWKRLKVIFWEEISRIA